MHWKTVLSVNLQWSLKTDKSPCRIGVFQEWRRKLKDFVKDVFSEEETAPCEEDVGFQDEGKLHVCFIPSFILAVQLQYKYTCFIFIPRFIPSFILSVYNTSIHASSSYRDSYQASYLQYTIQVYMLHLHTGFIARDFLHQVSCSTHSLPMLLTFTQKMEELYISEVWERVLHTYLIETLPALVVFLERNWAARRD